MYKIIIPLAILIVGLAQQTLSAPTTIDPTLLNTLKNKPTTNVILSLREKNVHILSSLQTRSFATREDRLNTLASTLKSFTAKSQANVLNFLEKTRQEKSTPIRVESLWITNQIIVRDADLDLVQQLFSMEEVEEITGERFYQREAPLEGQIQVVEMEGAGNEKEVMAEEFQWGVEMIEAPVVWDLGNRGERVIVATIDTGVRASHESLKGSFLGDFGWFDPSEQTDAPSDPVGMGTHATGVIAGTMRNIGVAPGSKWSACRGCSSFSCSTADLLSCGQWVVCPTDSKQNTSDCSKAPRVVSNSWGSSGNIEEEDQFFNGVLSIWELAEIIPLFPVGSGGPSCKTVGYPAAHSTVIAVGASTRENIVATSSSRGPVAEGQDMIKPDVVAPGVNIFSAFGNSDSSYASISGTSLAVPHASGVIALILSQDPSLSTRQVRDLLNSGSVPTTSTNTNCGGVSDSVYPNFVVGHGRIDALGSISNMS